MLDAKLKASVAEICERLDRAARIARAAQTRVEASNIKKAIEVARAIQQPICALDTSPKAVTAKNQICQP
jgi:hypothetical protein